MKNLLVAVLAGLFIISPAIAEESSESGERHQRRERRERKGRKSGKKSPEQWKILQEISKEESERLRKLHATDLAAWKKEVATIVKRIKAERKAQEQQIKKLAAQYKSAKDDTTKKEALEQLHKLTQAIFLKKMQKNKMRLESLEKHVKSLRKQYEFRKKNADKIIKSRVNSLTQERKFDW